jgi:D-galacturonate reductase
VITATDLGLSIFTPDPTHLPIALYAISRGHHVRVTKPAVKTVAEHEQLLRAAEDAGVFV